MKNTNYKLCKRVMTKENLFGKKLNFGGKYIVYFSTKKHLTILAQQFEPNGDVDNGLNNKLPQNEVITTPIIEGVGRMGEVRQPANQNIENTILEKEIVDSERRSELDLIRRQIDALGIPGIQQNIDEIRRSIENNINLHNSLFSLNKSPDLSYINGINGLFSLTDNSAIHVVKQVIGDTNLDISKIKLLPCGAATLSRYSPANELIVTGKDGCFELNNNYSTGETNTAINTAVPSRVTEVIDINVFGSNEKIEPKENLSQTIVLNGFGTAQDLRPYLMDGSPDDPVRSQTDRMDFKDDSFIMSITYRTTTYTFIKSFVGTETFCVAQFAFMLKAIEHYTSSIGIVGIKLITNPIANTNVRVSVVQATKTTGSADIGRFISQPNKQNTVTMVVPGFEVELALAFTYLCQSSFLPLALECNGKRHIWSQIDFSSCRELREVVIITDFNPFASSAPFAINQSWFLNPNNVERLKNWYLLTTATKHDCEYADSMILSTSLYDDIADDAWNQFSFPICGIANGTGACIIRNGDCNYTSQLQQTPFVNLIVLSNMLRHSLINILFEAIQDVYTRINDYQSASIESINTNAQNLRTIVYCLDSKVSVTNMLTKIVGQNHAINMSNIFGKTFNWYLERIKNSQFGDDEIVVKNGYEWSLFGMISQQVFQEQSPALIMHGCKPVELTIQQYGKPFARTLRTYHAIDIIMSRYNYNDISSPANKLSKIVGFRTKYPIGFLTRPIFDTFHKWKGDGYFKLSIESIAVNRTVEFAGSGSIADFQAISRTKIKLARPQSIDRREIFEFDDNIKKQESLAIIKNQYNPRYRCTDSYLEMLFFNQGGAMKPSNKIKVTELVDNINRYSQDVSIRRFILSKKFVTIFLPNDVSGKFDQENYLQLVEHVGQIASLTNSEFGGEVAEGHSDLKIFNNQQFMDWIGENAPGFVVTNSFANIMVYAEPFDGVVRVSNNEVKFNMNKGFAINKEHVIHNDNYKNINNINFLIKENYDNGRFIAIEQSQKIGPKTCAIDVFKKILTFKYNVIKSFNYTKTCQRYYQKYGVHLSDINLGKSFIEIKRLFMLYKLPACILHKKEKTICEVWVNNSYFPYFFTIFDEDSNHFYELQFISEEKMICYLKEYLYSVIVGELIIDSKLSLLLYLCCEIHTFKHFNYGIAVKSKQVEEFLNTNNGHLKKFGFVNYLTNKNMG